MRQRAAIFAAILVSVIIVMQAPATAAHANTTQSTDVYQGWPEVGYNSANTGHAPNSTGPQTSVNTTWEVPTEDWTRSTVAVHNGTAYAASDDGTLYAINTTSGDVRWEYTQLAADLTPTSPTVTDELVLVKDSNGTHAIHTSNGTLSWSTALGEGNYGAPAVRNQTVYAVQESDGLFHALDLETGEPQWNVSLGSGYAATHPAIDGSTAYVTIERSLYAINLTTHTTAWTEDANHGVSGAPTVTSEGVFLVTGGENSSVIAYSQTGQERWTREIGGYAQASPTVANGTVYIGDTYGRVFALDAQNGTTDWTYTEGRGWFLNEVVAANNTLYASGERGTVYAINPDNGTEQWRTTIAGNRTGQIEQSPPVVVNESIYITTMHGGANDIPRTGSILRLDSDTEPSQPSPITGDEPPTDPDNDGVYEDVNGDGSVNILDVQVFFAHQSEVEGDTRFDYNGDGSVNILDTQALFSSL